MTSIRSVLLFHLLLFNIIILSAQQIFPGGGAGSYNLTQPPFPGPDGNPNGNLWRPIGNGRTDLFTKGPNYPGPVQTHQWWTSALWNAVGLPDGSIQPRGDRHSDNMYPYPLQVQAVNEGMILRYRPFAVGDADNVINWIADIDMRVGLNGVNFTETQVNDYGDWHAVFRQQQGANTLFTTSSKGSPYAYFQRQGTAPIALNHNGGQGRVVAVSSSGNAIAYYVQTSAEPGRIYGLFFPPNTGFGVAGNVFGNLTEGDNHPYGNNFNLYLPAGSNYFSIAVLPDQLPTPIAGPPPTYDLAYMRDVLDEYEQYAFNFITATTHSYNYNEGTAQLTTNFDIETSNVYGGANNGTLTSLYLHQYRYSPQAQTNNAGYTYKSPRGEMRVINGTNFRTEMTHHGILPGLGLANTGDPIVMRTLIDEWLATVNLGTAAADGYNKDAFAELSNNIHIADQIGHATARDYMIEVLRERLTDWMVSDDADWNRYFAYDPDFNWMAHYPSAFGSSGIFVDAHFHVGHFVYAAAVLARYDPTWATTYGGMVNTVIRSINDYQKNTTDPGNQGNGAPWFPYLRYFDPYTGHSWAGPEAGDQESVSEALHFAAGTFLWGETTGNDDIRALGALLYITEAEAARTYWYDMNQEVNRNSLNSGYQHDHMTIVRASGGNYATFFTADCRWMHSITILPETASSTWLTMFPNGAQNAFNEICSNGGPNYGAWGDHGARFSMIQAGFDGRAAVEAWNDHSLAQQWINPTFPHVNGKLPMVYQWSHTFDSVGVMDASVQADITGYAVFKLDTCDTWLRHYMFYNPPGQPERVVTMTDGTCWVLPQDTIVTYKMMGPNRVGELVTNNDAPCNDEEIIVDFENFTLCGGPGYFDVQMSENAGGDWTTLFRINTADSTSFPIRLASEGTYLFRAIMINEGPDEMVCHLNDTASVEQYLEIVVQNCGCTTPTFATISPEDPIKVCDASGTVALEVSSDAPNGFLYTWFEQTNPTTPLNTAPYINETTFTVQNTGNYFVIIADPSDPSECFIQAAAVSVEIISPMLIIEDANSNPQTCSGNDGFIRFSGADPLTTYEVSYLSNSILQNVNLTSDVDGFIIINNLEAGTYADFVFELNGCNVSIQTTITLLDPEIPNYTLASTLSPTTCGGNDGEIVIEGLIDNTVYQIQYTINNINQSIDLTSDGQGNITLSQLTAGNYEQLTIAINNCIGIPMADIIIDDPDAPVYSFASTLSPTTCGGNDGEIVIEGLAVNTVYQIQYTINNINESIDLTSDGQGNITLSQLPAGNYEQLTIAVNNCIGNPLADILINDPDAPIYSLASTLSPTTCGGNDGEIVIEGLTQNTTYEISYNYNSIAQNTQLTSDAIGAIVLDFLSAGTYSDLILSLNGCSGTALNTSLNDPDAPVFSIGSFENTLTCAGAEGSITLMGLSMVENYQVSYQFNGSTNVINRTSDNNGEIIINDLRAGNYTDFSVSKNSCTGTIEDQITLFDPNSPDFTITQIQAISECRGADGAITLRFTKEWADLVLNYTYNAQNQSITINTDTDGEYVLDLLPEGVYGAFSVSDNGCNFILNDDISISAPPLIDTELSLEGVNELCENTSHIYTAILSANISNYELTWQIDNRVVGFGDRFEYTANNQGNETISVSLFFDCMQQSTYIDSISVSAISCETDPLMIPNAFTPNSDGNNDVWEIRGLEIYNNIDLRIYNRWGNMIYSSFGIYRPWDGTFNGNPVAIGTYYYLLSISDTKEEYQGSVTVLR